MERLTKKKVKSLSDREVETAYKRIKKDHSFGLVSDKKTSAENTRLLEDEIQERESSKKQK